MSIECVKKTVEVERLVGSAVFQLPVQAEAPVPGAGRESVEIAMEDAFAAVKDVEAQSGRVLVSGQVQCQAAYRLGEENSLRALTARASFEQAVDIEGVEPGMAVRARASTDHVEAAYDNGHMVFRVAVTVSVRVSSLTPVEAVTGFEGDTPVETRLQRVETGKTSAENSETVTLSDSVALPTALHARVVLMQWASPRVESVERDLGGVRLNGGVQIESLVASSVAGRPVALVRYRLPFEALVGMPDWVEGEAEALADVSALSVEVEEGEQDGEAALKMQCELLLTVRMNAGEALDVVSDAYIAGDGTLSLEQEEMALCGAAETVQASVPFRGTLLLDENAPGAGTALAARVRPVVSEITDEQDGAHIRGLLEATALYMPSGSERLSGARGELPFDIKLGRPLGDDADVRIDASDAEAAALMSDRMELKCTLTASGAAWHSAEAVLTTGAQAGEDEPRRRGVGLYWPETGEGMWEIGKRYRVAQGTLQALNPAPEGGKAPRAVLVRV